MAPYRYDFAFRVTEVKIQILKCDLQSFIRKPRNCASNLAVRLSAWIHCGYTVGEELANNFFCIAALFLFNVCWYSMYKSVCEGRMNWLGNCLFSKQVSRVIRIRTVQMKCRQHAAMTRTRLIVTLNIRVRLLIVKKVVT
jgi:hypothetical protein